MSLKYYEVPIAEITAHAGDTAGGYDAKGLHNTCAAHDSGKFAGCSPNPDIEGNGPATIVIIGVKDGSDPTVHYASAVEKTRAETRAFFLDPANECWELV